MRGTEFAEMTAFVAVAERRSFAKAADHLGIGRSTLSQNLRALEERLGTRLFNRTTRSVALTESGARLLSRVKPALQELTAAAEVIERTEDSPSGQLRIVVQPPVASQLIAPIMASFLAKHPAIRAEIAVVKMPADIVREGYDAGIRFGEQIARDMIAIRVTGEARFVVVASPQYLARHGAPKTLRDLHQHNCIRTRLPNNAIFGWDFLHKGRAIHLAVDGRLIVDDIELSVRAALDGIGVNYLLHDYVAPHLADGRLIELLKEHSPRLSGFYLYHPSNRRMTPPLRAFIDFLKTETKRRGLAPSNLPRASAYPNYRLVGTVRRTRATS